MPAHMILKIFDFLVSSFESILRNLFLGSRGQFRTPFINCSTEELDCDVCHQMSSVSFNVRFLCSVQTETSPTVLLYAAVPAFFCFLCAGGGDSCPLVSSAAGKQ